MEKMKRLLSGFLALVMVLGMMPGVSISAGAEELETQPETVAVETTQETTIPEETAAPETTAPAVTEPAETAAPETVPVETEAEETVPQETVPAETVPAETIPAQTVPAETVPTETVAEETVPQETVPEETVEELDASAEAADANYEEIIPVEEIVVTADKTLAYYTALKSDRVKLTYAVTPENASETTVSWVLSQNEQVFRADDSGIIEGDGVRFDTNTGLLTATDLTSQEAIVAELYVESVYTADDEYQDEEEKAEEEENPVRSEPVKVTFVNYWMEINLLPLADINRFEEEDDQYNYATHCRVKSGESLELSVKFMRGLQPGETAAADRNYVAQCLSNPQVEWTMNEGAEQYVTLGTGTDSTKVTLKAKTVTRTYIVTLTAKDQDTGLEHSVNVVVYPEPYKVLVEAADYPEYITVDSQKGIITYDLNKVPEDEEIQPILLSARVYPKEYTDLYPEGNDELYPNAASYKLTWECSDQIISLEDPDEEDNKNNQMWLTADPYQGSTTITITSEEDPGLKATVTVKRVRLMDPARLHISVASSKVTELIAGQSETFTAIDTQDKEILSSDVVEWTLPNEEDHPYASITKTGKLTVKDIAVGKVITLRCSIIDHPAEDAFFDHQVIVRPKATKVEILPGSIPSGYDESLVCNGETLFVKTNNGVDPFSLGFKVYPVNTEETELGMAGGAKQEVTWKSSNASIASIDPYTSEIVWEGKNGTVTITATAADGSGKKATVKLNFCQQADSVEIILPGMDSVRSGSSLPLDVKFTPDSIDAANDKKDVTWKIVDCNRCGADVDCAKISTSGKITAKTVYEDHTITVHAIAKDGSNVFGAAEITVKPKKDGILVLKEGGAYVTKTTRTVDVGDSVSLEAYTLNFEDEQEYVTWKSSNKSIAVVDEYGSVEVLKTGSATITATAGDGRKATVTIKGVRMASEVIITQKTEQTDLASGKSLTLKATPVDDEGKTATVKKVRWTLEGEGAKYATINSSGKLTAAKNYVGEPVTVDVVATTTDGSNISETYSVTIYPIVQGVRIDLDDFERTRTSCLYQLGSSPAELSLSAISYPENASQDHTWKSSSKSIAEVDAETGELTIKKAGTVTITATANDGSGKKSSFKLKIVREADDITFSNANFVSDTAMVIAGGKKVTLKLTLWDADGNKITGRKLEWSIKDFDGDADNGLAYASISSKGVLTTKKVSEMKRVVITVKTVEESSDADWAVLEREILVDIYPATTSVKIVRNVNGSPVEVTTTLYVQKDGTLDLDAVCYNTATATNAAKEVTWKTSSKKLATVDENGVVTAIKAGTVTITATAKDGTGKKDTVKIVVKP